LHALRYNERIYLFPAEEAMPLFLRAFAERQGGTTLWAAMALLLMSTSACTTLSAPVPTHNIVMVDRTGATIDPTGNHDCKPGYPCNGKYFWLGDYRPLSSVQYAAYMDSIFRDLMTYPVDKNGKRKILIFVHGGLGTQLESIRRATATRCAIADAGYYPIFVNWQSSFLASYFSHLLSLRRGEDVGHSPEGWLLAPFYFVSDLARAASRYVSVSYFMFKSDIETMRQNRQLKEQEQEPVKQEKGVAHLAAKSLGQPLDIKPGDDVRGWSEKLGRLTAYIPTHCCPRTPGIWA
jgi:hypothetical protein